MDIFKLLDRPIAFQRSFVRLGAGISGALFLSQAVYWNARTSDPDGWFFKTQNEWEEETGLKRTEQEKARKSLVSLGILEELKKGLPAKLYYRVNENKLALALQGEIQKVSLDDVLLIFSSTLKSMSKTGYMRALNIGVEAEYVDYVEVLKLHGMTCSCCGNPIVFGPGKKSPCLSFDHVIPLAKNGQHVFENLRPAHFGCNSSKGDKLETNKDVYTKQTCTPTQSELLCLGKANIHTEITTENIDPSKSPVGRDGGHVLRERLISLLEGKFDFDKAGELHDAVEAAIVDAGFDCQREYPVADRGDGRRGRVDLLVTGSDGEQCGIEIDRINVRDKSITKLKQLSDGFILVRDGVITERYEFDGIAVIGAHPATSSVANISREQLLTDAKKALEFYNVQTGTRCRDMKPFLALMTPTTTRDGYTLDDVQLVIRWVLATWRRRGDSLPKPANICRVCRFDGYLADAEAWAVLEAEIDPEAVMSGYNEIFADTLPAAELDDDRRRMITRLAAHMKNKTTGAFLGYFEKFRADAPDFYFGTNGGWRASFDYLMKPETLRKTREGAL
ncbi:HNH endonuclease [Salmonella enterica]|nr:HNH endonuclease signature motif containing protein [Salmonella enterica]EBP0096454.1 HNH endonuclease [Salmonella enterica]EEJ7512401.1 HNH endonuclease [Salmonella enterica subsp. salamae]EEO0339971.1 HNH endonuclease [Salmonella enterica]